MNSTLIKDMRGNAANSLHDLGRIFVDAYREGGDLFFGVRARAVESTLRWIDQWAARQMVVEGGLVYWNRGLGGIFAAVPFRDGGRHFLRYGKKNAQASLLGFWGEMRSSVRGRPAYLLP